MFEIKKSPKIAISALFGGSMLVILLDQAVKYKIRQLGGFYICNKGISFGLPIFTILFWLILAVFVFLGFVYVFHLIKNSLFSPKILLAFVLLLGGAASNALDRIIYGCVIDVFYLNLTFLPVFNVADIGIFLGSILLVLSIFQKKMTTNCG